jgi:DNA-binding transcriptional LysR family regulator
MDLRKLEIFSRVAELGNFSHAANSLHMAQPAVSIAVRKLEEELETRLFDRSGKKVTPTAEGRELLRRARLILREVEDLKRASSAMSELLQGELSIACPSMLATYFLPDLLASFLAEHPGLQASVTQAGTTAVEQMLMDDEIEIGVTTSNDPDQVPELELVPLTSEQIVLCMAKGHPWAKRRYVSVKDLHKSSMAVYESGYFIRSKLDQLCHEQGVQPDYRMQSNFLPLLVRVVKQGLGTTIGLKVMAQEEPGLVGVPLSPRLDLNMALAKRRGRTISRANQAFLDWVAFKL